MTDRSLKAEAEALLKHTVQICHGLIRTGTTGPCMASENATKSRFGQTHVDVGVLCGSAQDWWGWTHRQTHTAGLLHISTLPLARCQLCVLWICHTLKGWWRNTKPKHQFTVRITRTARTWGRAVASWNRWGERKKWIRIKIQCPWILKLEMFWLLPGLGAQGIDPGNLAFLEHGSHSVSCIAERLPFHTTMKNYEFQHFSRNRPTDRLWSHSIGQRGHVAAVWLGLSQRLLDHAVSAQLFQQSEVVHMGVLMRPPISSSQKNSLL